MTDVLTPAQRTLNMSRIRSRDTRPEWMVRSLLHRDGYRYRLHRRDLPGCPDLVFVSRRKVIFVHGCFWHMHRCRYGLVAPKTNAKFWKEKREGNVRRDRQNVRALRKLGWRVLVVWECQLKNQERMKSRIEKFLES
jgi:DNA mismatch endonuclease (patch repair protein)